MYDITYNITHLSNPIHLGMTVNDIVCDDMCYAQVVDPCSLFGTRLHRTGHVSASAGMPSSQRTKCSLVAGYGIDKVFDPIAMLIPMKAFISSAVVGCHWGSDVVFKLSTVGWAGGCLWTALALVAVAS